VCLCEWSVSSMTPFEPESAKGHVSKCKNKMWLNRFTWEDACKRWEFNAFHCASLACSWLGAGLVCTQSPCRAYAHDVPSENRESRECLCRHPSLLLRTCTVVSALPSRSLCWFTDNDRVMLYRGNYLSQDTIVWGIGFLKHSQAMYTNLSFPMASGWGVATH